MTYSEEHRILQQKFNLNDHQVNIPELNLQIVNLAFKATRYYCLPGIVELPEIKEDIRKNILNSDAPADFCNPALSEIFDVPDTHIPENNIFRYILLKKPAAKKSKELILLFHGLNEKSWTKYLSWGSALHRLTGKTIILFPISFHMNRCPDSWSNSRLMNDLSGERKSFFPGLYGSSFANAAISTRLTIKPQRFFFSGFQTYYDLIKLLREIRADFNPFIDASAQIDIFSYSIGAFLSEVLFFSGSNGFLDNARLCMFCGGTTTDKFRPVVKTIMDSAAYSRFYDYYAKNFDEEVNNNPIMKEFYRNPGPEALAFKSLLSSGLMREFRECRLKESAYRIYALPLKQDNVIPAMAVEETLKGQKGDIPIRVETIDFPYKYTHEIPFPATPAISKIVDECFESVFCKISEFFR